MVNKTYVAQLFFVELATAYAQNSLSLSHRLVLNLGLLWMRR